MGEAQAIEESYPPEVVPATTQTGNDGEAKKQIVEAVEATTGALEARQGSLETAGPLRRSDSPHVLFLCLIKAEVSTS